MRDQELGFSWVIKSPPRISIIPSSKHFNELSTRLSAVPPATGALSPPVKRAVLYGLAGGVLIALLKVPGVQALRPRLYHRDLWRPGGGDLLRGRHLLRA